MSITARRVLLGAVGGIENYWIAAITTTYPYGQWGAYAIDFDVSGNVYAAGAWSTGAGASGNYIAKWDAAGNFIADARINQYGTSGTTDTLSYGGGVAVAKDGTGDVVLGLASSASNGTLYGIRMSSNLDAVKAYQAYGGSSSLWQFFQDVVAAPDGSVYLMWNTGGSGTQWLCAQKLHPSSNTQYWAKAINGDGARAPGYGTTCVDDSSNLIIVGTDTQSETNDYDGEILISKIGPDGTLAWKVIFGSVVSQGMGSIVTGACCDSSGNIFITHYGKESDLTSRLYLSKVNPAGVRQWTVYFKLANGNYDQASMGTSGKIVMNPARTMLYLVVGNDLLLVNPSTGTPVSNITLGISLRDVKVGPTAIYAAGYVGGGNSILMKVPVDGSLGGSYTVGGVTVNYAGASNAGWSAANKTSVSIGDPALQTVSNGFSPASVSNTPAIQSVPTTKAKAPL